MFPRSGHLTDIERLVKQVAIEFPGAMGIGTGQRGFVGSLFDAQMPEFSHAAGQSAADFAQTLRLGRVGKTPWLRNDPGC